LRIPPATIIYRFGAVELDPASPWLTRGSARVHLTDPQSSVRLELVSKAPAVVSRDDLARAGWGGAAVTDNSIQQAISRLRRVLGDTNGSVIATVPTRGYRIATAIEFLTRWGRTGVRPRRLAIGTYSR
jgi:DNA-binding winged helix-turn-helix (wHTH) protein